MEASSRLSSKGQITIPSAVRRALALGEGDRVHFQVVGDRAVLAKSPELMALTGSVSVPADKRGTAWTQVLRETRRARATRAR
jgi:AbrB family looped-hinge helix DNA binding protein